MGQRDSDHPAADTAHFSPIPLEELVSNIDGEADGYSANAKTKTGFPSAGTETGKADDRKQYIRFLLEDILFALPLSSALEIGDQPAVCPLPNLPDWILGVSNIRGEILSIIDLKAFFGLPSGKIKRNRRFITVFNRDMKVGIIVDKITGILSPNQTDTDIVRKSPYVNEGTGTEILSYVSGVITSDNDEKNILNIFDTEKFLSCPRMTAFRSEK